MRIQVYQGNVTEVQVDALIVNLFEGVQHPGGATGAVDQQIGGLISKIIANGEFTGKLNETAVIYLSDEMPFRKVVVVGLGKREEFSPERVRQVTAAALRTAAKGKCTRIGTILHGAGIGGLDVKEAAQCLAEGAILGQYRYDVYKSDPESREPIDLWVIERDPSKLEALEAGLQRGTVLAQAANFARDLVNAPGNELTPTALAERARAMAEDVGLDCTVLDRDELERLGMGALLAVAKGSAEPPKLVVLRYKGSEREQPVALVGKGVTFDSGGISLKPSAGMAEMKGDMAGAAAVLGAMKAIAQLQPKEHVIGIIACVENMPSGTALKPGDIVRSMTGKTIEIDNTDAEGRLILADAVAYAESLGAHTIVDVATLTGACIIALGNVYTGAVGNNSTLADEVIEAGRKAGERIWQLPADPEYKEQYKSDVADIKNTGGREAGAITGALIIGEFVKEARWLHLDIAGTAWTGKEKHYIAKGGTGVAVRTLAEWICQA